MMKWKGESAASLSDEERRLYWKQEKRRRVVPHPWYERMAEGEILERCDELDT